MADDEWVTRTVRLQHIDAVQTVPLLRPLLPQQGHLAAVPASNTLILVDRYGNTRRVLELLRAMDKPAGN